MQVTFQQGGIDDLQEFFAALDGGRALHERRRCRRIRVIQLLHKVAAFLWGQIKKNTEIIYLQVQILKSYLLFLFSPWGSFNSIQSRVSFNLNPTLYTHTHLGEVIDESQVSLLQLRPGQSGQRVGIVQLFAVVWGEQVWVQPDHMGGICRAQQGKYVLIYSTYDTWVCLLAFDQRQRV